MEVVEERMEEDHWEESVKIKQIIILIAFRISKTKIQMKVISFVESWEKEF